MVHGHMTLLNVPPSAIHGVSRKCLSLAHAQRQPEAAAAGKCMCVCVASAPSVHPRTPSGQKRVRTAGKSLWECRTAGHKCGSARNSFHRSMAPQEQWERCALCAPGTGALSPAKRERNARRLGHDGAFTGAPSHSQRQLWQVCM